MIHYISIITTYLLSLDILQKFKIGKLFHLFLQKKGQGFTVWQWGDVQQLPLVPKAGRGSSALLHPKTLSLVYI